MMPPLLASERSSAWLERQLWELDVAGSNPVAPTILPNESPALHPVFAGFHQGAEDCSHNAMRTDLRQLWSAGLRHGLVPEPIPRRV